MPKATRQLKRKAAKNMLREKGYIRPNKLKWHHLHGIDIEEMSNLYLFPKTKKHKIRRR